MAVVFYILSFSFSLSEDLTIVPTLYTNEMDRAEADDEMAAVK